MRTRHWVIGIVVVLLVLLAAALLVGGGLWMRSQYGVGPGLMGPRGMFGFHRGFMMGGLGSPFGVLGGIVMLLFWVAVVVAVALGIAALVRRSRGPYVGTHTSAEISQESPLDILKRRYARGEINHDEYEQMKERIESQ